MSVSNKHSVPQVADGTGVGALLHVRGTDGEVVQEVGGLHVN